MKLFRREPLVMRFERREAVLVPQTNTHWALHADVFFRASAAAAPLTLTDAYLCWEAGPARHVTPLARCRWDRAVLEGKFRYPIEPLAFDLATAPQALTLTFDAGLIRRPEGDPPADSRLVLRLDLSHPHPAQEHRLWRVRLTSWSQPAQLDWLVPTR